MSIDWGAVKAVSYDGVALKRLDIDGETVWQSGPKTASKYAVGESVFLNVDGVPTEFIVVHQGLPSTMYDVSCDGTWLLMKNAYTTQRWDGTNNDYANSDVHAYLNGTFLGLLDSNVQSAIRQAKIPYVNGTGSSYTIASGANGLSAKIFLLGGYEVGWSNSYNSYFLADGAKLSYFDLGTSTAHNNKRKAYLSNGSAVAWWTRSARRNRADQVWQVNTSGGYTQIALTGSYGVRPALILPGDFVF